MTAGARPVRAPRGSDLTCRGWPQEAAYRMLQNNLDPEVAERPDDLVVYGGTGRAARSWDAFDAMCRTLTTLAGDETMLVQSGKPVGVFRTHEWAPRVLIANSNLVPEWGNWEEFRRLEALGLTMYGQMTAGSWIYIGTQGILQGTYECFAEIARRRFGGTLAGTITLTAGLGGMGGAQPLAVTMNDGVALCIEVDAHRIERRLETAYLDECADSLDDAIARCERARDDRRALSVGVLGNAAELVPQLLDLGFPADIVTDQTSAHDPLSYVPADLTPEATAEMARTAPDELIRRSRESMATHCRAMVGFLDRGSEVFDYGNSLRAEARLGGFDRAFDYPGFLPAYIRPLFCEGKGPFRWVALSGDPADIAATDRAVLEEFPDDAPLARWIQMAGERVAYQGLPARICWLGYGERHRLGLRFNEMVRRGELSAPIVIGRDHLDSGSVASPYRETEAMIDGSDAIADWPLLNALVNTSCGATWISIHHGGGVGIGRSIHAGMVCVADGTELAAREARTRAHRRSRHGRDAPRRRRLRPGDRGGRRAGRADPDAGAELTVTVREILTVGHPLLRERAREVTADELAGDEMQALIDDLIDTMHAANGAGIAAPQIGVSVRIATIEVNHNPRYPYKPPIPLTVVVNPVIEPIDDEQVEINEGCLSVPNLRGNVMRSVNIRVRSLDRDGVEHDEIKRGLTAGTYQHECDHLDGMLFLDRVHDTRSLTTWEQFERYHRDAFVSRITEFVRRVGS